ncbi:glutamine amidotransferase [Pokkaliibacter sp. CJK22405]|uniref:glutamine amidotransferase n=1 Tax=Pokkaliibacter sp. CJK22405 TaxID=3384615 RepID=UPI00398486CD
MPRMLVVKAGETFPQVASTLGDFDQLFINAMGLPAEQVDVCEAYAVDELPDPSLYRGIVVTGSHAMVSDREPWSERLGEWLVDVVHRELPLFAVCYGHQLLAQALGGEVGYHPDGPEIGTVEVSLTANGQRDELFGLMPSRFRAQSTHYQTVLKLPRDAQVLASNSFEPHHSYRVGPCAWATQFHPEFTPDVMRGYIAAQEETLRTKGIEAASLIAEVGETVDAVNLLRGFARYTLD